MGEIFDSSLNYFVARPSSRIIFHFIFHFLSCCINFTLSCRDCFSYFDELICTICKGLTWTQVKATFQTEVINQWKWLVASTCYFSQDIEISLRERAVSVVNGCYREIRLTRIQNDSLPSKQRVTNQWKWLVTSNSDFSSFYSCSLENSFCCHQRNDVLQSEGSESPSPFRQFQWPQSWSLEEKPGRFPWISQNTARNKCISSLPREIRRLADPE